MVGKEKESYNRLVSVGWSLEEFVQLQENKNSLSKAKRDVSLLKKFLVSRNEPGELENIDARDLRSVNYRQFSSLSSKGRRRTIRAHIANVFSFKI